MSWPKPIDFHAFSYGSCRKEARNLVETAQRKSQSLIPGVMPFGGQEGSREGKKGSDKGIDGVLTFIDDASNKAKRAIVQVKSGHVNSGMIRDLIGTVQRENATIGVFVTLDDPTKDMVTEALTAGLYNSPGWRKKYPIIQIYTIEDFYSLPLSDESIYRNGRLADHVLLSTVQIIPER